MGQLARALGKQRNREPNPQGRSEAVNSNAGNRMKCSLVAAKQVMHYGLSLRAPDPIIGRQT